MNALIDDITMSEEPFDRLTTLCAAMVGALDGAIDKERDDDLSAEHSDVRGIIFLSTADKAGIEMFGYPDTESGLAELFVHLKAIFTAIGKDFGVMTDQGIVLLGDSVKTDG